MNMVKPVKSDFGNTEFITGDLLITISFAKNLTSKYGHGDVYIELKTYEHNFEEENFGQFALDESFQRGIESQQRNTKLLNRTSAVPFSKTIYFNEEKNMGTFIKGATHTIVFIVKQETSDGEATIGEVSIKSDDYLDPFRPAKELYLLLNDPPLFVSSLYINMLFIPSANTLQRMGITKSIPQDFDSAYHEWIISKSIYVDQYGFIVPIGKYHPRLVNTEELRIDEEDYEEHKDDKIHSKTPEKRLRNAVDLIPSLREYNHDLKHKCGYRPDYEEILYHFRQMEMYLNNEAKVQAKEIRQEYCWEDYLQRVTDNIKDSSIEQGDNMDEFGDENFKTEPRGHIFSVANRANWDQESWQNIDIQAL